MTTFKTATSYALKDPTSYDDEYGTGYGRVETYGLIECGGMSIVDCWVTNNAGEIHPGMAENPVPVRFDNVITDSARPAMNAEARRSEMMWA